MTTVNKSEPWVVPSAGLVSNDTKLRDCLGRLHDSSDVGRTAYELVAIASRDLDVRPTETLRWLITGIRTALLERTIEKDYLHLARLHGAVCTCLLAATPSYVRDPAICDSFGHTFTSRQLVRYQVLDVMRETWRDERGKCIAAPEGKSDLLAAADASLRRVTLCAFVDELWCLRAVTDRMLYDFMGLLRVTTVDGLDLEATCLCRVLLRRGRRLWQQSDSRDLVTALCMRLSTLKARKDSRISANLLNMLLKLEDLHSRHWTDASKPLPAALAGWRTDPEFRQVRSRLGQIAREHVASRSRALGWPPVSNDEPVHEAALAWLDQEEAAGGSLPALDMKVDVWRSLKATRLQLSWDEHDTLLAELVRWGRRCDDKKFPMHRFIATLYEDAKSSPSWEPLYYLVISRLQRAFPHHAAPSMYIAALREGSIDGHDDSDGVSDYESFTDADADAAGLLKRLVDALTTKHFDPISDLIIERVNASERKENAQTLVAAIRIIFETAADDESRSPLYARLCRKMVEQISDGVMDETIRNAKDEPVKGGLLFHKYLLKQCQGDFERGWSVPAHAGGGLLSDEHFAAQKAKRRGLGLVRFIGELFKLQMLTERIMHECIKKLLTNVDNPGEEEVESICKLLSTVGQALDTTKARSHMDIYFKRMRDLSDSQNIDLGLRFMLRDVIELRERKWIPSNATAALNTQSAVRDQDHLSSRTGTRSGTLGCLSVFASKKSARTSEQVAALLRARSGMPNPFAMLTQNPSDITATTPSILRSRKPSAATSQPILGRDFGRRKLELPVQPRTRPQEDVYANFSRTRLAVDVDATAAYMEMLAEHEPRRRKLLFEAQIKKQIELDTDEVFAIKKPDESEQYFESLPEDQRHRLVDAVFRKALEGKDAEATLAGSLFARVLEKGKLNADILEKGFAGTIELLDDIAVDAPAAYALTAKVLHMSKFDEARVQRLGGKIAVDGDPLVAPKDKLLTEFKKLSS